MATALLFFPLSSPTSISLHRNPKPSPSSLRSSLSISRKPYAVVVSRTLDPSARAVAAPARSTAVVDADGLLDISKLGISEQIVSALAGRGITELFPIQRAVLEPAMEGRDMIGRAITGSGKTLAFGIPILDKIIRDQSQKRRKQVPSALVLAPTRELARQVQHEFKMSAPNLSSTCLYGGVPIMNQVRSLRFGMDIVVGTPGRIIDLVERGALDLSEVSFVVLDEADQMLNVGFQEDVECILSYLPEKKQCLFFSATMPSWVHDLSRKYLKNPLVIDLVGDSEQKLAEGISLYSVSSSTPNKQNLLPSLISNFAQYFCKKYIGPVGLGLSFVGPAANLSARKYHWKVNYPQKRYAPGGKSIIFTRTKKDADSLSRSMGNIVGSRALHGDMQQFQRDKTLTAFRDGHFNVLVATDVAARGLDIPNVDLIIHFELPNTSEIFVHRSGRTGRAGNKGTAVLMFTESQRRAVRTIEHDVGFKFEELQGFTGGVGAKSSNREAGSYAYDDSVGRRFGRSDSSVPHYGNQRRVRESNVSRYSEQPSFRGSERSRSNNVSRKPEQRQACYGKTRSQFNYDDFEDNYASERNTGNNRFPRPSAARSGQGRKSRRGEYDGILDLFKDQY